MIRYKKKEIGTKDEQWTGNEIGAEGAKAISEALKINTTLTLLDLNSDDKIVVERNKERKKKEMNNEQITT